MAYRFKAAESEAELEQVFTLTYKVFAQELHQYAEDLSGRRIDKFHHKNKYVLALLDDKLVGMVCLHSEPPFSVTEKLADPAVLQNHGRLIEVRLLAVLPEHRNGRVMAGLMLEVFRYAREFDAIAISGVVEETRMYRQLGFRDLGPAVRSGEAWFVPMVVRVGDLEERQSRWKRALSGNRDE